jgi:hypothetical protein
VRLVVDPGIRCDRTELDDLVRAAFEGIDASAVEVRLERIRTSSQSFTGRAYGGPIRRPRVSPGTAFVVRLWLPAIFRNRAYPKTYRYPGRVTAPWITVRDWKERLVALAAHEAFHVHQFREGLRRSEVAAERWADRTLTAWRSGSTPMPAMPNALMNTAGEESLRPRLFDPDNWS